jgi:RNA polymerase sigma-70 factor (ECF subfamily)
MTGLEELYRRHAQEVFRFAYWLSGNRAEAEDITSDTFVRAWAGGEDLRLETVKAYLIAIARNLFLQRLRRSRRLSPLDLELADPRPAPDHELERHDELRVVREALRELSESDRAALLMHAEMEMPYEEIARVLGVSLTAIKVRVHRARIRLARRCEQLGRSKS